MKAAGLLGKWNNCLAHMCLMICASLQVYSGWGWGGGGSHFDGCWTSTVGAMSDVRAQRSCNVIFVAEMVWLLLITVWITFFFLFFYPCLHFFKNKRSHDPIFFSSSSFTAWIMCYTNCGMTQERDVVDLSSQKTHAISNIKQHNSNMLFSVH